MPDIFGVIADPTRRDLLVALARRGHESQSGAAELSVGELVEMLTLSQPTVSKHLKVLRDAGLVKVREVGQHRNYSLNLAPLSALEGWLQNFGGSGQLTAASGAQASATSTSLPPSQPVAGSPTPVDGVGSGVAASIVPGTSIAPDRSVGTAIGRLGADVAFAVVDAMATFLRGPRRVIRAAKRPRD